MGYLVCQRCGGYYKLQEGESLHDFISCQCYGPLKYVENLNDVLDNKKKLSKSSSFNNDVIDLSEQTGSLVTIESDNEDDNGLDEIDILDDDLELIKDSKARESVELDEVSESDDSFVENNDNLNQVSCSLEDSQSNYKIELNNKIDKTHSEQDLEKNQIVFTPNRESAPNIYSPYLIKEQAIKNRAYYQQAYYGDTKPDIKKYKLMKDVDSLITSLKYPDPGIKQEAVQALGVIGNERALKPLEEFIKAEGSTLKIYAEIAVNQIKSKKYGFKSRNRRDYRDSYFLPKDTTTSELPENGDNSSKGDIASKDVVSTISFTDDITPEKLPETVIHDVSKKSKTDTDKKDSNKGIVLPESTEPNFKTNDTKSNTPIVGTRHDEFSDEKSSGTNHLDENTERNFDLDEEVRTNFDLDKYEMENSSVGNLSVDDNVSEDSSSEIDSEEERIFLSHYLGSNILDAVSNDRFQVHKPSDMLKEDNSLDDNFSSRYSTHKENSSEITHFDKTKTTVNVNKPLSSTQSKFSGFSKGHKDSNDNIISTDKGTPLQNKNFDDTKELTTETALLMGTPLTKNSKTEANTNAKMKTIPENKEDDIYFIKFLGIKNSDKPVIGFIILFVLALVIGVVLTMNST